MITAFLLVFLLFSLVRAEENAPPDEDRNGIPDAVEETASGIVRVEACVEDRDGNHRKVKSQTGFLLGDESAGYAITAYHDLIFSNDEIGKLKEEWSAGQEREVTLSETSYQIIYNGDIHKKASLYEGSAGKDLAILRLDSPLSGELGLTLASEEEAVPEEVWIASYLEDTSVYSESAVQFLFGPLIQNPEDEENPTLTYRIRTDAFSAGAPVLNAEGHVIGVHGTAVSEKESKASAAAALSRMLDHEKITYRMARLPQKKKPGKVVYILGTLAVLLLVSLLGVIIRTALSARKGGPDGRDLPGNPRILRISSRETVPVVKTPFVIGTHAEKASYCVRGNPKVSHVHAAVFFEGGRYYLADLGSSNGTVLNGRLLPAREKERLHDGDSFYLANEEFVFRT